MLKQKQKDYVKQALDYFYKGKISLAELQTGFGKTTYVIPALAVDIRKKTGKTVIISTYSNQLVNELYDAIIRNYANEIKGMKVGKVIGVINYLDITKLDEEFYSYFEDDAPIKEYFKEKTSISLNELFKNFKLKKQFQNSISDIAEFTNDKKKKYLDIKKINKNFYDYFEFSDLVKEYVQFKTAVFFDDLFAKFIIPEDFKSVIAEKYHCEEGASIPNNFDDFDIVVTNHVLLLRRSHRMSVNGEHKKYNFILDEVDKIYNAQEIILTASFSVLRLSQFVKNFVNKNSNKDILLQLRKMQKSLSKIINKHINGSLVGQYIEINKNFLHAGIETETARRFVDDIRKEKALKLSKKTISALKELKAKELLKEYQEMLNCIALTEDSGREDEKKASVRVYYSPAKGFPTIHYLKADISISLANHFFSKINGCIGISGTIYPVPDPMSAASVNYMFYKMGIYNFPNRVPILVKKSDFKRENARIHLCDKNFLKLKYTDDIGEKPDENWVAERAEYIAKTYNHMTSLVITGSFAEAKAICEKLKSLGIKSICATPDRTVNSIIEQFKREGGILVGTRNYAIGIDLPGKLLEKVYIVKLLFPVKNSRLMLDADEKSNRINKKTGDLYGKGNYYTINRNEMYIMLRQSIGRLLRTEKDEGDIYILDARVHEPRYKSDIFKILEDYGTIVS